MDDFELLDSGILMMGSGSERISFRKIHNHYHVLLRLPWLKAATNVEIDTDDLTELLANLQA